MLIFKTIARRAGAVVKTLETNGQTILMQIPEPADVASNSMPRRAVG